jgi:PAS domain-containing protein
MSLVANKNKVTERILMLVGVCFCLLGTIIPLLVLTLRFIDYPLLYAITPGHLIMNPLTSICLIIIGISTWLSRTEERKQKNYNLVATLCILVITYSSSMLAILSLGYNFEPDRILLKLLYQNQALPEISLSYKGLGINNAIGINLLAISLLFIDKRKILFFNPQSLNYFIIFLSFLTIYGYVYSVEEMYTLRGIPLTFYSSLTMLFLSSSILFLRPFKGSMKYLVGQNPAEVFMMRFLAFFIPLALGYLRISGEEAGLYAKNIGTALMAVSTYLISITLLGWKSTIQYKLQLAKRKEVELIEKDRKRIERILNNSQTFVQIINIQNGIILFSNESGRGKMRTGKEIEGKTMSEIVKARIYPDDFPVIEERQKILPNLKDQEYNDITFRVIGNQGEHTWLFSRASVFSRDESGAVKEILFTTIDFTNEKKKESKLQQQKVSLEQKQQELEIINRKLEEANNKLEEEAQKRASELYKSEKRYKDYIINSFSGIIEFEHKSDINTRLPVDEQVKKIREVTRIKEVNQVAAELHGYKNPDSMRGMPLVEFVDMPDEIAIEYGKEFIRSNYRLIGKQPIQLTKEGKPVKVYSNLLGIVKDHFLVKVWEIQRPVNFSDMITSKRLKLLQGLLEKEVADK